MIERVADDAPGRPPDDARRRRARARRALRRGRRAGSAATSSASTAPKTSRADVEPGSRVSTVHGRPFLEIRDPRSSSSRRRPGIREFRLRANGLRVLLLQNRVAPVATFAVVYHVGSRNEAVGLHGRDAPARAPHVQGHARVRPREGHRRRRGARGARARASTRRPGSTARTTTRRSPPTQLEVAAPDRGLADAAVRCCATRTALPEMTVVRNEFERGENSPVPGPLQAHLRDGVPRAPVPPPDDRLAQRHRGRDDGAAEGVLRHLLPPEQRDRDAHRRLRGGGRRWPRSRAHFGAIPAVAAADPARLHGRAAAGRRAALHGPPRRPGRLVRPLVAHRRGAPRRHARARRARQHPRRRASPRASTRRSSRRASRSRSRSCRGSCAIRRSSRSSRRCGRASSRPRSRRSIRAGDRARRRARRSPRPSARRRARRSRPRSSSTATRPTRSRPPSPRRSPSPTGSGTRTTRRRSARVTPEDVQRVASTYLHDDALTVGLYLPKPARREDRSAGPSEEEAA